MAALDAATSGAAAIPAVPADDDDAWLYGDDNKGGKEDGDTIKTKTEHQEESKPKSDENGVKKDDREEGEMSGEEGESQEKEDDDDSDDDDVQVTIGDIKAWSVTEQPRNLFKSGTNYQKPVSGSGSKPTLATKGIDIEAQGTINGVPVYEFDLDSIQNEDKPWRKPGADITDYFNYGFTEETWQQYCEKQRRLIAMNEGTAPVPKLTSHYNSVPSLGRQDKDFIGAGRKSMPPAANKIVGQINVIGGTAIDSRRPESEGDPIPVAGSHSSRKYLPPPGLPPTNLPPPHMPPVDYSIPPPGMPPPPGVPPPGMTVPPPGFPPVPDPFDPHSVLQAFYAVPPPDRSVPPPGFDERSAFGFTVAHTTYTNTYNDSPRPGASQQWETSSTFSDRDSRDREWDRERRESNRRDRSPHRPEEDYGSNRDRVHERERDRDRDRDRDRERDRDRSDRKRDRESRRSRSRDRDRDSERRDRDDDKHRSRRSDSRKHRDDSDSESTRSSSKHKSRRRRREKEEDLGEAGAGGETPKAE